MLIQFKTLTDLPSFWHGVLKGITAPLGVYFSEEQAKESIFNVEMISLPDSFDQKPLEQDWNRVGSDIYLAADMYGEEHSETAYPK